MVVDNTFAIAARPAAAVARRGHRLPLRDEVPGRSLGHRQRRAGHLAATTSIERLRVPPERDRRGARAVRLLPRPARPADARAAHGAPLDQRAGRGAARWRRATDVDGRALPGPGRRATRASAGGPGRAPDGARRRHGLLRPGAERRPLGRGTRARASARRPGSSAWPSRSAASSRCSRCRPP